MYAHTYIHADRYVFHKPNGRGLEFEDINFEGIPRDLDIFVDTYIHVSRILEGKLQYPSPNYKRPSIQTR